MPAAPAPSTNPNRDLVRRLYEEAINGDNRALFEQLVAPDYVGIRGEIGPDPFAAVMAELRTGFPDIHYDIEDLIAEGDKVAIRWRWTGTHRGTLRTYTPTGRSVTNAGMAIYQLRDGKLVRAWLETDRLGFLQQIGVLPELPGAPVPAPAVQASE